MHLRSPLAALTAAILNTASTPEKHMGHVYNNSGPYHEGSGTALDESLSASMISGS